MPTAAAPPEPPQVQAADPPSAVFPASVGGFAFGISLEQAERTCVEAMGAFSQSKTKRPNDRDCSKAPVDPFWVNKGVKLTFCDGHLCMVTLRIDHRSEESQKHTRALLQGRYGHGVVERVEWSRIAWRWTDGFGLTSSRLIYDSITVFDSGNAFLGAMTTIEYSNQEGLKQEAREAAARNQNY